MASDVEIVMVKGDSTVLGVPGHIHNLACVQQLRRQKLKWQMCLDDSPSFHLAKVIDGVSKGFIQERILEGDTN